MHETNHAAGQKSNRFERTQSFPIPAICEKFFLILHKVGTECLVTTSRNQDFWS